MKSFEETVISRLQLLEREVERLRVKESPGAWLNWTPTITYTGGTTDPTTTTITSARYCKVGKIIFYAVRLDITRGSSNRTTINVSVPVNFGTIHGVGYARQNVLSSSSTLLFIVGYSSGQVLRLALGSAMDSDGYIVISGFYEAA